jgi:hypothetical protein
VARVHHVQRVHHNRHPHPAAYAHRPQRVVTGQRAFPFAHGPYTSGTHSAKHVYPAGGGTLCQLKTYSSPTKSGYTRTCKGPTHRSTERKLTINRPNIRGTSYSYSAANVGPGGRSTVQHRSMRRVANGSVVQSSSSRRTVSRRHR